MEQSLERNSLVGTTIPNPQQLPQHLSSDEKHSWVSGKKVYVATTVEQQCIFGVSIAENTGEKSIIIRMI
ncbi:MAG: hypothetical protein HQM14_13555 [SAR324 cluster bacterium]|nr:hypothetical protein [SAR324 cluster bacterium]